MKLETVEKKLGLTYPRAFREIYEAGAMGWLTPEHQRVWASGDMDALKTLFLQTNCCKGTDYVSYQNQ